MNKLCLKCNRKRRLTAFVNDRKRLDGKYPYCRDCQKQYSTEWYSKNRVRENAKQRVRNSTVASKRLKRQWHLKTSYDMTIGDYEQMRRQQNGLCLICRDYFGRKLVVDHDHDTGKVRGLLCLRCNSSIGLIEHDPRIIARVLKYLHR